ncbi:MAG: hypothetical protein KJN69_11755 [Gammaproteobacteria bacterium]|nr:hypothetical protein [Gammaproteobacteria bacterium]
MKTIFTILLLFFWSSISAEIRPEYSGMWYNHDQRGHGLSLEVLDAGRTVGFWYLYDMAGAPFWLLLDGVHTGNRVEMTAYHFDGMVMGEWDPATNSSTEYGKVIVEFTDCNNATLNAYTTESGTLMDSIPLQRLTHIAGLECHGPQTDPPTMTQLEGDWNVQHGQAHPFNWHWAVIEPDGTYSYGGQGGMARCEYSGQISIEEGNPPWLSITYTSDLCTPGDTPFTKSGNYYENYIFCVYDFELMNPDCESRSQVMVFPSCPEESELCLDSREIILWRD